MRRGIEERDPHRPLEVVVMRGRCADVMRKSAEYPGALVEHATPTRHIADSRVGISIDGITLPPVVAALADAHDADQLPQRLPLSRRSPFGADDALAARAGSTSAGANSVSGERVAPARRRLVGGDSAGAARRLAQRDQDA